VRDGPENPFIGILGFYVDCVMHCIDCSDRPMRMQNVMKIRLM